MFNQLIFIFILEMISPIQADVFSTQVAIPLSDNQPRFTPIINLLRNIKKLPYWAPISALRDGKDVMHLMIILRANLSIFPHKTIKKLNNYKK